MHIHAGFDYVDDSQRCMPLIAVFLGRGELFVYAIGRGAFKRDLHNRHHPWLVTS
jgi:hypothetical protein